MLGVEREKGELFWRILEFFLRGINVVFNRGENLL